MTTRPFAPPSLARPTALVAAAVCLLSAAPLRAADEYYSLAGLKSAGLQKFIDDARSQGYEIAYINGCNVGDHVEYAGVGLKHANGKVESDARFDLTDKEVQEYADEMKDKGFRPTELSAYHAKEGTRFAASWVREKGSDKFRWSFKFNLSQKELDRTIARERDDGMYPYRITAYQGNDGSAHYSSLFLPLFKGATCEYAVNLTADQLDHRMDRWHSDGFFVLRVHAYDTPDGQRFLAVARRSEADSKRDWRGRVGLTGDQYQKAFDQMAGEGYTPICICEYRDGGTTRFAALWLKSR